MLFDSIAFDAGWPDGWLDGVAEGGAAVEDDAVAVDVAEFNAPFNAADIASPAILSMSAEAHPANSNTDTKNGFFTFTSPC